MHRTQAKSQIQHTPTDPLTTYRQPISQRHPNPTRDTNTSQLCTTRPSSRQTRSEHTKFPKYNMQPNSLQHSLPIRKHLPRLTQDPHTQLTKTLLTANQHAQSSDPNKFPKIPTDRQPSKYTTPSRNSQSLHPCLPPQQRTTLPSKHTTILYLCEDHVNPSTETNKIN